MSQPSARGWTYLVEPDAGRWVPRGKAVVADDGRVLTVRHLGHVGRLELLDEVGAAPATALRVLRAAEGLPAGSRVHLVGGDEPAARVINGELHVNGAWAAASTSHWPVEAAIASALEGAAMRVPERPPLPESLGGLRVLFFESLMNAEMPHNDAELSQGVLHMASSLGGLAQVVFANVKMAIVGTDRPVEGMETLRDALAGPPIQLVCITLLEGYWDGVVSLIRELRAMGCRAHIAVGGVMPSLAPDAVAAHLPDVSFIVRGAGEVALPKLARLLTADASVDLPLTPAQVGALLQFDGLYVRDQAGNRVLAANSAAVPEVGDLDRVHLDLRYLRAHHFAAGLELASSRGCAHRCTFCSILGRERYQARSAGSLIDLLHAYDAHIRELFGDSPPRNARRVHFSDDDFACDRDRALDFFRAFGPMPFRLSSMQVSIADLCRRESGQLLPEPDVELLDAIRPEYFDDHARPIAHSDFVADHRTRRWSSYLQIGVESFSDRELTRLGKGYLREHVRAIVADLSRRTLHHDAYFILSNHLTSFDDLIEVLDEVVRLKHLFPLYFHIRFPVVARLVSYATSAQHRRILRAGQTRALALRGELREPHHSEFDYPLVDHDEPSDAIVRRFVDEGLFTDDKLYAGTFARLWDRLAARWAESKDLDEEFSARTVDDRQRRRVFELLDAARRADHRDGDARSAVLASPALRSTLRGQEARMMQVAEQALGPSESWLPAFGRFTMGGVTRLVVIPTWQCELRCNYCYIPKQDGRVMTEHTLRRSINLLLSSERRELTLQFFGGEALLEWGLVRTAIEWGTEQADRRGKVLDFVLSSNGWSLDEEKLDFLRGRPVKLELSLDGAPDTQRRFRPAAKVGVDSYAFGIAPRAAAIVASGLRYDVIMVVHPEHAARLAANYLHIVDLGFDRVQINFALGKTWSGAHRVELASQLFALSKALRERPHVTLVNAENAPMPMRLNAEPTVDWDGTVYGGNAFLHETEHKARFRLGHLDDLRAFDRYWMDAPPNRDLVAWSYPKAVTENNLKVGAVMSDFVRWWRSEHGLS